MRLQQHCTNLFEGGKEVRLSARETRTRHYPPSHLCCRSYTLVTASVTKGSLLGQAPHRKSGLHWLLGQRSGPASEMQTRHQAPRQRAPFLSLRCVRCLSEPQGAEGPLARLRVHIERVLVLEAAAQFATKRTNNDSIMTLIVRMQQTHNSTNSPVLESRGPVRSRRSVHPHIRTASVW